MRQTERTAFPCLPGCVQQGRAGQERARSGSCVNEAGAGPRQHHGQKSSWPVEKGILRSMAVGSCFLPGEIEVSSFLSPQSISCAVSTGLGHSGEGAHSCPASQKELVEEEQLIRVTFAPEMSSTKPLVWKWRRRRNKRGACD